MATTKSPDFNNAAEEAGSQWQSIVHGSDAAAFADRIVAYETNVCYYGNQSGHWQIPGSPTVYFGYVGKDATEWDTAHDRGPNMPSVLKPNGVPGNRVIIGDIINKPSRAIDDAEPFLRMREASADEIPRSPNPA
jgi:hypothetical protein